MKALMRLSLLTITLLTIISNVACTKSSSSDPGSSSTAASVLALQSVSVAASSTANLTPTGGTPPYTFSLQSSIGGNLLPYSTYAAFTAGTTSGILGVTVTDSS